MQIRECRIKNFGKFHQTSFAFQEGINLIYGKNESGKTTLFHFMKSMLFGLEKQRGKSTKMDTFSIYEPWDMAMYYEGILKFTVGGKPFRIERGFAKAQRYERCVNEEDGEELNIAQGDLQQILDGLNEAIFSNTIAVGQQRIETGTELAREMKNFTTNRLAISDGEFDIFETMMLLKEKKKEIDQQIKREVEQKEQFIQEKLQQQSFLQQEIREKERRMQEQNEKYDQLNTLLEQNLEETEENSRHRKRKVTILVLGALAGILLGTLVPQMIYKGIIAIVTFLFLVLYYKFNENVTTTDINIEYTKEELKKIAWSIQSLEEEKNEKLLQIENSKEAMQETAVFEENSKELKMKADACMQAQEQITSIANEIQMERKEFFNRQASQIMQQVTKGRYKKLFIDENLKMKVHTDEKLLNPEQLSRGTFEELYFALRMAAANLFFEEEEMPLFFDDSFVYYDEERLARVLHFLAESKRQVLIFTCQKREQEILNQLAVKYHFMELR